MKKAINMYFVRKVFYIEYESKYNIVAEFSNGDKEVMEEKLDLADCTKRINEISNMIGNYTLTLDRGTKYCTKR